MCFYCSYGMITLARNGFSKGVEFDSFRVIIPPTKSLYLERKNKMKWFYEAQIKINGRKVLSTGRIEAKDWKKAQEKVEKIHQGLKIYQLFLTNIGLDVSIPTDSITVADIKSPFGSKNRRE